MLTHYSPLKVAEQFRMLETLSPAASTSASAARPEATSARRRGADARGRRRPGASSAFPDQVGDLIGFLTNALPADHRFASVHAMPAGPTAPRALAPRLERRERRAAPLISARRSRSRTSSMPTAGRVTRAYARPSGRRRSSPRPGPAWRSSRCARTPKRKPSVWPEAETSLSSGCTRAGPGPTRPSTRPSASVLPPRAGHRGARAPAHGRRHARAGPRAPPRAGRGYGVDELVVVTITHDSRRGSAPTSCSRRPSASPAAERSRR